MSDTLKEVNRSKGSLSYRNELDKLDTYFESGKLHHSVLSVMIYKFLYWIKVKLNKKEGWIDFMSRGKDCMVMTDVITVLHLIVSDVSEQISFILNKEQNIKFKELENISKLIIDNFDKPIRSNPNIIYDEDETISDEIINCNMIHKLENLIQIDIYLDD